MKPIKENVSDLNKRIAETFPEEKQPVFDPKDHQILPPPLPVVPADGKSKPKTGR